MSQPYIAEIKIFAGNFAPRGWSFCNGTLLPISQNTALFSLIGTIYGGDGRTTTGLPNLQGRAPMHPGRGPGLTPRKLGEVGGVENVTLTAAQMPNHNHLVKVTRSPANEDDPVADGYLARAQAATSQIYSPSATAFGGTMKAEAIPNQGSSEAHTNMQPYQVLNYIIALTGTYPSRS